MDKFIIEGGIPLRGEILVGGAKNSALPALAACLLTEEPVVLHRIPRVRDVRTMERLLKHIGAKVERNDGPLRVTAAVLKGHGLLRLPAAGSDVGRRRSLPVFSGGRNRLRFRHRSHGSLSSEERG